MAPVILILASGYFIGGALGDFAFQAHAQKGASSFPASAWCLGAIFITLALNTPIEARNQFFVFMCLTAIFMPLSSANVIATVYDVTVPEVRSTAQATEYFVENAGAAFAPILTGLIADAIDLKTAILLICMVAWGLCFIFYIGAFFTIDKDTTDLRHQMARRAESM
jgi:MFS transporter, Spinster family, sphingosine-1-phosphate transporter